MSYYNALKTGGNSGSQVNTASGSAYTQGKWNNKDDGKGTDSLAARRARAEQYRTGRANEANRQRVSYLDNAYAGQQAAHERARGYYNTGMDRSRTTLQDAAAEAQGYYDNALINNREATDAAMAGMNPYIDRGNTADDWVMDNMGPDSFRKYITGALSSDLLPMQARKEALQRGNAGGGSIEDAIAGNQAYQREAVNLEEIGRGRYEADRGTMMAMGGRGQDAAGMKAGFGMQGQSAENALYGNKANVAGQFGMTLGNLESQIAEAQYNMENGMGASYANYMNARGNQGEKYFARHDNIMNALYDWQMIEGKSDFDWERQAKYQADQASKDRWASIASAGLGVAGSWLGGKG